MIGKVPIWAANVTDNNGDNGPIILFNFSFKIGLNNKILKVAIKDNWNEIEKIVIGR